MQKKAAQHQLFCLSFGKENTYNSPTKQFKIQPMKLIIRSGHFSLFKKFNNDKFRGYYISAYLGSNKTITRILCYKQTEEEALIEFQNKIKNYNEAQDLREFIENNVRKLTKHDNPNYIHYDEIMFKGSLGKKLEAFYKKKLNEPVSSSYKSTVKCVINQINNLVVREENLTKELVDRFYKEITNPESHLSPETVRSYKTIVQLLCKYVGKDERILLKDFVVQTKRQLTIRNIKFNTKNRRHFERSEIIELLSEIISIKDKAKRSNLAFMLWLGIRPCDLEKISETEDKVVVYYNKVDEVAFFNKDKYYHAYKLLLGIDSQELHQKHSSEFFLLLTEKLFGQRLDQYCMRHTVLSQRVVNGEPHKLICQEAGHSTLRMLDENYTKRIIKENSKIKLKIKLLEPNYRGWLLEQIMFLKWPNLAKGKPTDDLYNIVTDLLKTDDIESEQIDL